MTVPILALNNQRQMRTWQGIVECLPGSGSHIAPAAVCCTYPVQPPDIGKLPLAVAWKLLKPFCQRHGSASPTGMDRPVQYGSGLEALSLLPALPSAPADGTTGLATAEAVRQPPVDQHDRYPIGGMPSDVPLHAGGFVGKADFNTLLFEVKLRRRQWSSRARKQDSHPLRVAVLALVVVVSLG